MMDECSLTYAVASAAAALARCLSDDELTIAAAALAQLGDTLATIAARRSICAKGARDAERNGR
jgi:hypothetical protein